MSRERELLKRVRDTLLELKETHYDLYWDIQTVLDAPEREPLSDEEIYTRCCAMDNSYTCNFIDGVEWAEHQHGIRSFDDE